MYVVFILTATTPTLIEQKSSQKIDKLIHQRAIKNKLINVFK